MIQNKFSPIGKSALVAYEAGAKHKMLQGYTSDTNYGNIDYAQGCRIGNVYCYCTFNDSFGEISIHFSEGKQAPFTTVVVPCPSSIYTGKFDSSYHVTEHQGKFLVTVRCDNFLLMRHIYSVSSTSGTATLESTHNSSMALLSLAKTHYIELNGYLWVLASTTSFTAKIFNVKTPSSIVPTGTPIDIETASLDVEIISAVTSDNGNKNFFVAKDKSNNYCYGISIIECDTDGNPTKFMPMVLNSYNRFSVDDDFDEYTTGAFTLADNYIVDGYLTPDYRIDILRQSDEEGLFYVRDLSEIVNVKRNSVSKEVTSFPNNPSIVEGQLFVEYQSAKGSSLEVETVELEDSGEVTLKTFEQTSGSTLRLGKYTNIKGSPKEPMVIYGDGANAYSFLSAIEKSITETSGNYKEYAKGTWTPSFNEGVASYTERNGWWSRHGDTVHVGGVIEPLDISGGSENKLEIIGIPFLISTVVGEKCSSGTALGKNHASHFIYADSDLSANRFYFLGKNSNNIQEGERFYFQITYMTDE